MRCGFICISICQFYIVTHGLKTKIENVKFCSDDDDSARAEGLNC